MRGGSAALLTRFASLLAMVAVSALLTRLLPPSDVGSFFFLLSLVTAAATVGQLGLPRLGILLVSEARAAGDEPRARAVVRSVLRLGLIGAAGVGLLLVSGAGAALVRFLGSDAGVVTMILVAGWSIARAVEQLTGESFRAFQRIGRAGLMDSLLSSLVLIAILGSFLTARHAGGWHPTVLHVLAGAAAASGVAALVGMALVAPLTRGGRGDAGARWPRLLARSLPILGTTVLAILWETVGLWILSATTADQAELALYGSAWRVGRLIALPLVIANLVLMPIVAQLYARRELCKLNALLRLSATVTTLPALAATLILLFGGEALLGILFGPYYREGASVLILLALGQCVGVWAGSSGVTLLMTGRQHLHLLLNSLSLLALLISGILWSRSFGALGMAAAILVSQLFQQLLFLVAVRWRIGVWTCATPDLRRLREFWSLLATSSPAGEPDRSPEAS